MAPLLRRSWAPTGQTPVIEQRTRHYQRVSIIAALCVWPARDKVSCYFRLHPGTSITGIEVRQFIGQLLLQLNRAPMVIIWDWLNAHRSLVVRTALEASPQVSLVAREGSILPTRHLDYFYNADQIVLVEDAERPFTGAGKGAIAGVVRNGYLPRFHPCFCRLDCVEGETRQARINDVNAGLRNVLNALSDGAVQVSREELSISYVGDLDKDSPDNGSIAEIVTMLGSARELSTAEDVEFVSPHYDFELISAHLDHATQDFRNLWEGYLFGRGGLKQPWQTVKAFNRRMVWKEDGYKSLQPISELHAEIMERLAPFFASVPEWEKEAPPRIQRSAVDVLRQEFGQLLKEMAREVLLAGQHTDWESALELSGRGSTAVRATQIVKIVEKVAPPLTVPEAIWIKNRIKELVIQAIKNCCSRTDGDPTSA